MAEIFENWKTQIRKGYLELCILSLIRNHGRLYGFDLLTKLDEMGLSLKEGTLYPMLNRMTLDQILQSSWVTENIKGHPRKFYSLTNVGTRKLSEMTAEFNKLVGILNAINNDGEEIIHGIGNPTRKLSSELR